MQNLFHLQQLKVSESNIWFSQLKLNVLEYISIDMVSFAEAKKIYKAFSAHRVTKIILMQAASFLFLEKV